MKTKKELNEIKEEIEKLDTKLHELTEEELDQVTGGDYCLGGVGDGVPFFKLSRPGVADARK